MDRVQHAKDLLVQGRDEAAREILLRVLQASPRDAAANNLLSAILARAGDHAQALFYARHAAEASPDTPALLASLGSIMGLNGDFDGAVQVLRRAAGIAPGDPEVRLALARVYLQAKDFPGAIEVCRAAIRRGAYDPEIPKLCAATLNAMGRAAEAAATLREAIVRDPGHTDLLSHLAFVMNYDAAAAPLDTLAAHRLYGQALAPRLAPLPGPPPRASDPGKMLRVGFLSADLRQHSVSFFAEPLLAGLDRAEFELLCYSTAPGSDEVTQRLRPSFSLWREVESLSPAELASTIRADGVDIAIDLSGHSQGHRLAALSLRCAPLQVTYLGYPNTTGVPAIDARFVDHLTDPPGAEALATERLARLDPCFLCYSPPADPPPVAPRPPPGPVVFGSFNAMPKLNGPTLALWARALNAVPGSRLLIKNQGLTVPAARERLASALCGAGIGPDRVEFAPWAASMRSHLEAYASVDVALDTTPYNGTTTTCEALLMGVPVITLPGRVHAARVGLSLLSAAGLATLAARDPDHFAALAAAVASDRAALATLRASLRGRLLRSALCDRAGFAARFGAALRGLWRDRCADPAHMSAS